MPQVVKPQRTQAGPLQRLLVAPAQRGPVEVAAHEADEDEVVIADPVRALTELGERGGDVRGHGDRADLA